MHDLGYVPNRAAKALRFNYSPKTIGAILPMASSEFLSAIRAGIRRAEAELSDMGVRILLSIVDGDDDNHVQARYGKWQAAESRG